MEMKCVSSLFCMRIFHSVLLEALLSLHLFMASHICLLNLCAPNVFPTEFNTIALASFIIALSQVFAVVSVGGQSEPSTVALNSSVIESLDFPSRLYILCSILE